MMQQKKMEVSQSSCTGLLVWQESSSPTAFNGACYGVTKPLQEAYVDLVEHMQQRTTPTPGATLSSLSCIGSAVYQHQVDPQTGAIPPPACLGIELQRYRQAAMLQSAGGLHHQHQHTEQHQQHHAVARDIELLHADQHVSTGGHAPTTATTTTSSSGTDGYMHHAAGSSPAQANSTTTEGPEYRGRHSLLTRLQELHAEASERLDGQDPLWFGKAFAARAALNWESMRSMAGQVLESAKADLGLQTKSDESE